MSLNTFLITAALSCMPLALYATQADDQPQNEYQVGVIPGLNVPVKVGHHSWAEFSLLDKIVLAGTTLLHGTWACASTATTMRARAAQHALLWAASHGTGAVQTFSHELGHAVVNRARGAHDIEIGIGGDYVTLLSGIYGGYNQYSIQPPSMKTYDKSQSVTTKEDLLEYIDVYDQYKRSEIACAVAGPIVGAATGYGIFKLVQSKYPAVFRNRWFRRTCLAGVLGQTINFVPLHPSMDGAIARQAWQERAKMQELKAQAQKLPGKTRIRFD